MEYDLELLMNCQNNTTSNGTHIRHNESSASSSVSSSENTLLNFFNLPVSPYLNLNNAKQSDRSSPNVRQNGSNADKNISTSTISNHTSIPNSCSLIFSTAASFNINQEDTVVYARESIRLLAKSLATYSEHLIIRQLYAYAPDNLAWLWAFFDWESPIELSKVPCQDRFQPLGWCDDEDIIRSSVLGSNVEQFENITRIFAESPLIQYKYRQELMIGDLYKFMEHVQNVSFKPVAASLFCLYFPRFAQFIETPLKKFLNPKILKSNLSLIYELDNMLVKLMTRYSNISEYKQRIFSGPQGLPSYVSDVLSEMNFWQCSTASNRFLMSMLKSGMNVATTSMTYSMNAAPSVATATSPNLPPQQEHPSNNITRVLHNLEIARSNFKPISSTSQNATSNLEDIVKTLTYLRLLKTNKINCHLDYDSFDEKNGNISSHEMSNDDEQTGIDDDPANMFSQFQDFGLSTPQMPSQSAIQINRISSPVFTSDRLNNQLEQSNNQLSIEKIHDTSMSYRNGSRLPCMSPPPHASIAASRLIMNTPQTPNTTIPSPYLNSKTADYWTNGFKSTTSSRLNLTPPLSASKTGPETGFYVESLIPPYSSAETQGDDRNCEKKSVYVSSPNPRARYQEFSNYIGCQNVQPSLFSWTTSGKRDNGLGSFTKYINKPPPGFNNFSSEEMVNTSNDFLEAHNNNFGALNINTNLNATGIYSPIIQSPREVSSQIAFTPVNQRNRNQPIPMISPQSMPASMINMKQWTGTLPPKTYPTNAIYSRKVFLGGLPWDLNQNTLVQTLFKYGSVRLEVPGKDLKHPRVSNMARSQLERLSPGYVYVIFDNEVAVTRLLTDCRKENRNGSEHYFYNIFIPPLAPNDPRSNMNSSAGYGSHHQHHTSRRGKLKEVEVIPWNQEDSSYVPPFGTDAPPPKIESSLTVFVGGLHGMCNAQGLATFMSDVFGETIHAGLDVDKYKYPIGSGRVTFRNRQSYVNAITAHFVNVRANQETNDPSPKFEKNIQIEPYLDDCRCSKCDVKAQLFCRNEHCLENFCGNCWTFRHDQSTPGDHIALTRQNKHNNHGF